MTDLALFTRTSPSPTAIAAPEGRVLVNPYSGERLVFRRRAAETTGEALTLDVGVTPSGAIKPHIHPAAEETFRVVTGPIGFRIDGVESIHQSGELVTVPKGAVHEWWNPVDGHEIVATVEFRPAHDMETFFETWFGLAGDRLLNDQGRSSLLQGAVLFHDFRREITLPGRDGAMVRLLGPILAPIARRRGIQSRYDRYSGPRAEKPLGEQPLRRAA